MEIRYDKQRPPADLFRVTVYDNKSRLLRQEEYSRAQVEAHMKEFSLTEEGSKELNQQHLDNLRRRQAQIDAATQPAHLP